MRGCRLNVSSDEQIICDSILGRECCHGELRRCLPENPRKRVRSLRDGRNGMRSDACGVVAGRRRCPQCLASPLGGEGSDGRRKSWRLVDIRPARVGVKGIPGVAREKDGRRRESSLLAVPQHRSHPVPDLSIHAQQTPSKHIEQVLRGHRIKREVFHLCRRPCRLSHIPDGLLKLCEYPGGKSS